MLGKQTWVSWIIQPKNPNKAGKFTYAKIEAADYEEVEDVFAASRFGDYATAKSSFDQLKDKENLKLTKIFCQTAIALFRRPKQ